MHVRLLIALLAVSVQAEIGSITELLGTSEVKRQTDTLVGELAVDILSYDDVRTGAGRVAIRFLDDSVLRLTEQSSVVVDEFIYDPDPSKGKLAISMASGTARFLTGALGKIHKSRITVTTPTSTIGIRGTDFVTSVDEIGRSLVILLPDATGAASGEITVNTLAGQVVLTEPFQATMVSVAEQSPTRPTILNNLSLAFIDNLLIVNPPAENEAAVDEQAGTTSNVLDIDLLEEDALEENELEDNELDEVSRLDVDLLAIDFLQDLMATLEKKEEPAGELEGVKIVGLVPGFDPASQTYTFVEGEFITLFHSVENTFDLQLQKGQTYTIQILTAGRLIDATIDGGGDSSIVINQSP